MSTYIENLDMVKAKVLETATSLSPWQWAISAFVVHKAWRYYQTYIPIPTYGGVLSFSRVLSTIRLSLLGPGAFSRLYSQYSMVLVPRLDFWTVYVQSQFLEELHRAPDDQLSFLDATFDSLQARYVFGDRIMETQDHHVAIQHQLTRHLTQLFPEVHDEVQMTLGDVLKFEGDEWKKVHAFPFILQVVARASNRIFVGVPFCRNQEWLDFNLKGPAEVMAVATFLNLFPTWMHPLVGAFVGPIKRRMRKARKIAGPMIEERLAMDKADWPDDFITWLLVNAPEGDRDVDGVMWRLLAVNFAAIHTSSLNLGHALYWLLARPKYFAPLREEIEETVGRLGWTKDAIGQMPILDSFMKECMRITPLGSQILQRKALKPFTFSNGVTIPAGTYVAAHLYGTHHDGANYEKPDEFDGFRFVDEKPMDSSDEKKASSSKPRQTMYTTSQTYLAFGHGRHACPGRFFAAMELKMLMAYLIVNFDMQWPKEEVPAGAMEEGYRPKDLWFNFNMVPNQSAHMMIRKRAQI